MKNRLNGSAIFICLLFLGLAGVLYGQGNNTETILNQILDKLNQGDFPSALELFGKLPPEQAENTEIRILRANVLNSAGRPAEAIQIANVIISADRNNTEALMVLADAAALQNKERDRRNFLERVIAANPRHARALIDLGNLAVTATNLRVAAQYFDRALAAEPNNGDALVSRAVVHRYNRENRQAEQLLGRAIELYPDWAGPFHERARLYRGTNNLNSALRDLDAAKKLEPNNYFVLVDRGMLLIDMNRKQDALADFNRAIEISPDVFMAYPYRAGIKDEFGDYAGAAADYIKMSQLRPDYYFAFEGLGIIRIREKNWAEARDAFLAAYKQAPKEYNYALLAAVCWMRAGRQTDPKQFLAQVLRTTGRESMDFTLIRMYHDLNHDRDTADRIDREQNNYEKSRAAFYLASYYDIRGNQNLANRYYLLVQEMNAVASIEYKLNEMIVKERNLGIKAE